MTITLTIKNWNMSDNNKTQIALSNNTQFNFFNPEHFATMQRVSKMFANSDLVPDMYKISENNSESKAMANCMIAIEVATRIGANVLMVMQNMTPIYGKPSWSSKFLIATVNTCGRYEPLKFKFEDIGEINNYKYSEYETKYENGKKKSSLIEKIFPGPIRNIQCTAYTTAKNSDDILEAAPVSVIMAIDEGWYTKKGSKWPNMTKLMLTYRAASFWTSSYAPDLSMGMKTVEEMRDIGTTEDIEFEDLTPRKNSSHIIKQDEPTISKEISNNAPEEFPM